MSEADARVASCSFDYRTPRGDETLSLGVLDDVQGCTVWRWVVAMLVGGWRAREEGGEANL
jgi:hypothetical protein